MGKLIIPKRFTKKFMNENLHGRFVKFLGPIENFFGAQTIYFLNMRMFIQSEGFKFRIVNRYFQKQSCLYENFARALLRSFSDAIFTSDSYLSHTDDDFGVDYEKFEIPTEMHYHEISDKRMIGIYTRDLKLKFFHLQRVFKDNSIYTYPIVPSSKYEKFKNDLNFLTNCKFLPLESLKLDKAIDTFIKETKSELTLIEGLEDNCVEFIKLNDPFKIPFDMFVMAFTKDGDYSNKELSHNFTLWREMELNYIKVYQSKNFHYDDGSTWFFVVFKKRILFQKGREKIDLSNQTNLFDERIFRNDF